MKVKLGDIAVLINGDRGKNYPAQDEISSSGDIMFVNAGHLNGRRICFDGMNYISYEKYQSLNSGKFVAGDILYCLRGSLGKKALVFKPSFGAVASSLVIIRPNNAVVNSEYLMFALDSPNIQEQLSKANNGSSQPNLSAASVREYRIDLPSLSEQSHITKLFSKAQSLINIYRQQLHSLDTLIKARFVEMFGNDSYPSVPLINLITDGAGLSYGIVQPGDDGTGDMGVLRPVDLVDGKISTDSIKYIDRSIGDEFKKTELNGDELLITVRGTTGITALTDERFKGMNVTRGIAVIRFNRNRIDPVYLNAYLNTEESQRYIQEHTRGATLKQINLSDLRIQQIIVPPMELQKQFAAFAIQIDKSKVAVQAALEKAQLLFDSLMQQYFG